jgi:hypothetical protein
LLLKPLPLLLLLLLRLLLLFVRLLLLLLLLLLLPRRCRLQTAAGRGLRGAVARDRGALRRAACRLKPPQHSHAGPASRSLSWIVI